MKAHILFSPEAGAGMSGLTTDLVANASRIFLSLAYPSGTEDVPQAKRQFLNLPTDKSLEELSAELELPANVFQIIRDPDGVVHGYSLRLGCDYYPHLKMKILQRTDGDRTLWIFAVDTHDAFAPDNFLPPADHPDAGPWRRLQEANAELKQRIEKSWEQIGLMTFNALLRQDL